MVHCGYEATAVDDTFNNPLKALKVFLQGPRTEGTMAPELPVLYEDDQAGSPALVVKQAGSSCNSSKQVA